MTDYSWHIPDPATQPEFYSDVPMKRAVAWVLDSLIILVICLLILPFTAFTGLFFFPMLFMLVGLVYRIVTLTRGAATWGMRFMAIEMRRVSGPAPDLLIASLHTLGFTISMVALPLHTVSIILILTTARGQSLVDFALATVVINRRAQM